MTLELQTLVGKDISGRLPYPHDQMGNSGYHQPEKAIIMLLPYCDRREISVVIVCNCPTLCQEWRRGNYWEIQKAHCVYKQRRWIRCQRDTWVLMVAAALFTNTMIWDQPKCSSQNEEIKKKHVFATIQPQKVYNPLICNNMGGLRGHSAKWENSGTGRKMSHHLTPK